MWKRGGKQKEEEEEKEEVEVDNAAFAANEKNWKLEKRSDSMVW